MTTIVNELVARGPVAHANTPSVSRPGDAGAAPTPLPEPAAGMLSAVFAGDLGAELAALGIVAGQRARESAQRARDLFEGAQARQEDAQIAAMRQKADEIQTGALTSGLITIGEGLTQAGAGGCSFEGASTGSGAAQAEWQLDSKLATAFGTCLQGTATIASGASRAAEQSSEIFVTQARFAAGHAKEAADDMHDAVREAESAIHAAIEFYREYSSTESQSFLAALHRT